MAVVSTRTNAAMDASSDWLRPIVHAEKHAGGADSPLQICFQRKGAFHATLEFVARPSIAMFKQQNPTVAASTTA
jgi:hypothetical protein